MTKRLLKLILLLGVVVTAQAQTTILDFETTETSTPFQYFGSTLDGSLNAAVANPNPSGENVSATVANFVKPAVAEVWAGAFSNPNPVALIDLVSNDRIAIKVYMDHIGSLSLKLEQSTDGGDNWIITVPNTKVNEWETLIFDPAIPSIEAPNTPALGHTYQRVVLFFDFGTGGTGVDVTSYFDDIVTLPPAPVVTTILDFEAPETSTAFQYFGSTLDGTFTNVVSNPNPVGNESANVTEYVKPAVAEVWAGAFSNPNPTTPVTLDAGSLICIDVHMDHIGNLALKLEQGTGGQANWITTVSNTVVGEWEQICFDPTVPSIEAPNEPASGTYQRIVLFFDFGTGGTGVDVTSYFDNIVVVSSGAPQVHTVHFSVDMNQYTENFDSVYVSGTFNNWSGNANPLSDPDFDGVWEGDIEVVNGAYEYKVTLDNWAAQEAFGGFEECTRRDPSGQFVNRLLLVSGDTELPTFCFNSCYACGQEVDITFRLGFGGTHIPSPDGVWLAGGGNFDVPGGKFEMSDDDLDGIYEITVPRAIGFNSYYTFTNGNCPDYSCKENIEGQSCANPDNYNDRYLDAVTEDTVIETCFGECTTNTKCAVGLNDLQQDERVFDLAGNPAVNGWTMLTFGTSFDDQKHITVSTLLGQIMDSATVGSSESHYMFNTSDLPSGLYMISVIDGKQYYTRKLMK